MAGFVIDTSNYVKINLSIHIIRSAFNRRDKPIEYNEKNIMKKGEEHGDILCFLSSVLSKNVVTCNLGTTYIENLDNIHIKLCTSFSSFRQNPVPTI